MKMSAITLWTFQNDFYLINQGDMQNATLFRPVIEELLREKEEIKFEENILDFLSREKIFNIKDKDLVIESIEYLIEKLTFEDDRILTKDIRFNSKRMFSKIIEKLNEIDEEQSKYFVINADSRREHVRNWVERWSDKVWTNNGLGRLTKGGYILLDITKLEDRVTDFVEIEGEEIRLIPNNKFIN